MSSVDVNNGTKLIGFRKQNGLSKEEVCEIIGYKPTQLYRFEKGYVAMPESVIKLLNSKYNLKLKPTSRCKSKNSASVSTYVSKNYLESVINEISSMVTLINKKSAELENEVIKLNSYVNKLTQ